MSTIAITNAISIDQSIARICPLLPSDTAEELEASLLTEGCRDPLVVWRERNVLLDGHNRKRICEEHGIPYDVVTISLPDHRAAHDWVIRNQLARRNLGERERRILFGRLYNATKNDPTENLVQQQETEPGVPSDHRDHSESESGQTTADRIAAEHGVAPATVRRAGRLAAALDEIGESAGEAARDAAADEALGLTDADIAALAKTKPDSESDVTEFADRRRAERERRREQLRARRPSSDEGAFRQYEVVEVIPTADERYIAARRLSCGCTVQASRLAEYSGPKCGTKSLPCPTHTVGTRTPHDRRRTRAQLAASIGRAWRDRAQRDLLVEFVQSALEATMFGRHPDARAQTALERLGELRVALRLGEVEE